MAANLARICNCCEIAEQECPPRDLFLHSERAAKNCHPFLGQRCKFVTLSIHTEYNIYCHFATEIQLKLLQNDRTVWLNTFVLSMENIVCDMSLLVKGIEVHIYPLFNIA